MSGAALTGVRRSDLFNVEYNDPRVEVTVLLDRTHWLYDPRVERPVDREMVDGIKMRGIEQPAEAIKLPGLAPDGRQVVRLTKGRGRWACIQQAWKELLDEGVKPELLPPFRLTIKKYASEVDQFEAMLIENTHRLDEDPVSLARKVLAYINRRGDSPEVRERARILAKCSSAAALRSLLSLLDVVPEGQALVSSGVLPPSAAKQLAKLPEAQQRVAVEKVKAQAAEVEKIERVGTARTAKSGKKPPKPKAATARGMKALVAEAQGKETPEVMPASKMRARLLVLEARVEKVVAAGGRPLFEAVARFQELSYILGLRKEE